jgi:hypothetical protein
LWANSPFALSEERVIENELPIQDFVIRKAECREAVRDPPQPLAGRVWIAGV